MCAIFSRLSPSLKHGPRVLTCVPPSHGVSRDRRRLARAALAAALLGNDDHDPAVHGHIGRRDEPREGMTIVDPSLGHGQHARQRGHRGRHEGEVPSRRAVLHPSVQHVVLAARRPGRLPQLQELHPGASERHSCPLRPQRHLRRRGHEQSMAAEWATWAVTDLCEKNQAWTTGWHRLRDNSDDDFRAKANELHATGDWFAKQIEPEPAPEDPVEWATAEESDEDDASAPTRPDLVDLPPAPASAPPTSNFERCIALRLVALRPKMPPASCLTVSLLSRVSCPRSCFHVLTTSPRLPDSDKQKTSCFFILSSLLFPKHRLKSPK